MTPSSRRTRRLGRRERGQGLVEFALILTPLLLVMLGIIQAGLIFNAYVTVANAAREGARAATIYLYDRTMTKAQNDVARAESARAAIRSGMGMLGTAAPQFANSSTWTQASDTFTSGDLRLTYTVPTGTTASDPRTGQQVSVAMTYHIDLILPFISSLLPHDPNGRMPIGAQVTMVVN
jgi:Flp pilus assembly protein TadG